MQRLLVYGTLFTLLLSPSAQAAVPYVPVPVFGKPLTGPNVMRPDEVYGKEYSNDRDFSVIGPTGDPQQIVNWDGSGGVMDGLDYSFTQQQNEFDLQLDAMANSRDGLFRQVVRDDAHLVYSHDDEIVMYPAGPGGPMNLFRMPSVGPVTLANGQQIGGAGELSVELAGAHVGASIHELWAKAGEINRMPPPSEEFSNDVDGVEMWGPEPPKQEDDGQVFLGDADKYSLELDFQTGASIWNASGTPYMSHAMIVSAVESLLGPIPGHAMLPHQNQESRNAIDIDALMVYDTAGEIDVFDLEPQPPHNEDLRDQLGQGIRDDEPRDTIVFSIRQIVDDVDPDGYYATGSELFVLDSIKGVSFLEHGGHVWDQGYALQELQFKLEDQEDGYSVLDINALEAIGQEQEIPVGPCPGDFNADGTVDLADYNVWRNNLGSTDETSISMNGYLNGVVDSADYGLWKSNFGHVCPMPIMAASPTSVPEPGSMLLMAAATLAGLARMKRR
ncbi:PEP-CTERM sorting domain-containing protein [Aeoliella sp. ICT_H6.2]|uniref:PEP-CTERM sorting domain-containing protein n=1 Tax=Aeoliella straminimaris TaxID=2954799 RepID=A0A9X2F7X7_9BACT|nr:PEP-CTERM sorting domain-containing protein [Aeoliella straminimaris]MCO6043222.1 PEP-CTERM sorting domain-containing protein [Aeoliella straminimaris]